MATTAIGTLIPILRDNGELKTALRHLPAGRRRGRRVRPDPAGDAGRSRPHSALHESLILLAFIALALVLAVGSMRCGLARLAGCSSAPSRRRSQLAVRLTVVLVFGLVFLASKLGLDLLLGGFVAGMIVRLALRGHELQVFESKLTAVGFGFFVPFFFVTSGIEFDLARSAASARSPSW